MVSAEQSTIKFGFNTTRERFFLSALAVTNKEAAINYLEKQLKTQLLHVSRNIAVSLPYSYWLGSKDQIFTDPERAIPLQVDRRERNGLYNEGLLKAMKNAQAHPQALQFLYSPPGSVNFNGDLNSPYQHPYDIGQLYLIWSDGKKIDNIAISINQQGEEWVEEIFGKNYFQELRLQKDEVDKIKYLITNPVATDLTLDDFMRRFWQKSDKLIFYSNNSAGEKYYYLADIMKEMQAAFTNQLGNDFDARAVAEYYIHSGGVRGQLDQAYLDVYRNEMKKTGADRINLGGGCGGIVVNKVDLFSPSFNSLSSEYRQIVQSGLNAMSVEDAKKDPNLCRCGNQEPHFHCPGKIQDEKSDHEQSCNCAIVVGAGVTSCPKCGLQATCS